MSFTLPSNHKYYYDEVIKRSYTYVKIGFWSDIDLSMLNDWLNNFSTDEEKYLSALILDKIIYKNTSIIKSTLSKMFHMTLPNILEKHNIYKQEENLEEWERNLKNFPDTIKFPFRFTTITSEKELGDSGSDYMRRLRKYYLVNRQLLKRIDAPKDDDVTTLIVIDDIIASGEQTKTFIEENLDNINNYKYIIFMPLIAHNLGINNLKNKIARLEHMEKLNINTIIIEPVETMDNQFSFFCDDNAQEIIHEENTIDEIKLFYINLLHSKLPGLKESDELGHGSLSLLLLFSTGVPDNTLPIIHLSNKDTKWKALYEKF